MSYIHTVCYTAWSILFFFSDTALRPSMSEILLRKPRWLRTFTLRSEQD